MNQSPLIRKLLSWSCLSLSISNQQEIHPRLNRQCPILDDCDKDGTVIKCQEHTCWIEKRMGVRVSYTCACVKNVQDVYVRLFYEQMVLMQNMQAPILAVPQFAVQPPPPRMSYEEPQTSHRLNCELLPVPPLASLTWDLSWLKWHSTTSFTVLSFIVIIQTSAVTMPKSGILCRNAFSWRFKADITGKWSLLSKLLSATKMTTVTGSRDMTCWRHKLQLFYVPRGSTKERPTVSQMLFQLCR